MGILDKFQERVKNAARGLGEETIRVIDEYDDEEKQNNNREPSAKNHRPVKSNPVHEKKIKKPVKKTKTESEHKISTLLKKVDEPTKKTEPVKKIQKQEPQSLVLEDDEDYFEKQEQIYQENMKKYSDIKVPVIENNKIQDVLYVLNIPSTFEIENDVFLPEDLEDIGFNVQAPQGYDVGEVDTFVSRVKMSIEQLVSLLIRRNQDIAKLATVIDRLQVDANNARFQAEIANGINVIPTTDTEDLENENTRLRLLVKRLEENVKNEKAELNEDEREIFEDLQDQLSVKTREVEDYKEEIYDLKNKLAIYQDEEDENNDDEEVISDFGMDFDDEPLPSGALEESLPTIDVDEDEMPDLDNLNIEITPQKTSQINDVEDSVFFEDEEESIDDFMENNRHFYIEDESEEKSSIELLDENGKTSNPDYLQAFFDDDEEDALDKLQKWGQ